LKIENQVFEICLQQLKRQGSVFLLPTETVYGLVCDWDDSVAKDRIRKMKARETAKPFQMLAPDIESVAEYGVKISTDIRKVIKKFCPGPVTIIANLNNSSEIQTVGFRIPAYPFILDLMKESGKLFAATSANTAGKPPAINVADALNSLEGEPDVAVDAGEIHGNASTVIDMTGKYVRILREGPITENDLRKLKLRI